MANKLHLEREIKAAKVGKCWMDKNSREAEPLSKDAAPGWLLPPQIMIFYPKKAFFALDLALATQNAFPESSELLPPAPKSTPRTRSGPGGSVGIF